MKAKLFKLTAIMLFLAGSFVSCENENNLLSKELIASNLSKKGSNNSEFLIGEWDCIKFAYTEDGNKIFDVATISDVATGFTTLNYININVPDEEHILSLCDIEPRLCTADLSNIWTFSFCYDFLFYSISENLTSFITSHFPYMINIILTDDGKDVLNALKNAYSFVIKDIELIIYFTGVKNKNLLILKKR